MEAAANNVSKQAALALLATAEYGKRLNARGCGEKPWRCVRYGPAIVLSGKAVASC